MHRLPTVHCVAAVAFAAMAVAGLLFAAAGPVALIRWFGLVALVSGVAGFAVHAVLVRTEAPDCWSGLTARLGLQPRAHRAHASQATFATATS